MDHHQTRSTLYLGRNIPRSTRQGQCALRGFVSTDQLDTFFRDVVSPHFPGFTIHHTQGFWEGAPERTAVLTILCGDIELNRAKIQDIGREYCAQFAQDAVLIEETDCTYGLVRQRAETNTEVTE